jgi:hypothetical protein
MKKPAKSLTCARRGCYTDKHESKCRKCQTPIKANGPRHSFIDMGRMDGIVNFCCRCARG